MQVARHPVSAPQIDFRLSAILEMIDPAVLQETSDDAAHANLIAEAANPRSQRANAAHKKINFHARLRRTVQSLHNAFVEQRIHLGDDSRRTPRASMLSFTFNQPNALLRQV